MKRLTTDTPQGNLESALNLFYAKDGEAWIRGGGPAPEYEDVTLFTYIRRALNAFFPGHQFDDVDNDTLSEIMFDWLQYGPESIPGLIAVIYESAWAFAEIRARLKAYEDTGLEPAAVAAQKWIPVTDRLPKMETKTYHDGVESNSYKISDRVLGYCGHCRGCETVHCEEDQPGETFF